jgi:hypothetical protein
MFSFLATLFFLLIPIVLILIVRLKRRRRVVYSHTFLLTFRDEKLLDSLLRTFRIYHDVLFDLLIALVLALFLAQIVRFAPGGTAVCLDGSYSMVRGEQPHALDRAVSRALEIGAEEKRVRLFLLAWDRRAGDSRVLRLKPPRLPAETGQTAREAALSAYVERLRRSYTFFNIDHSRLQDLFDRGFQRVVFITDSFPAQRTNLEVVEVGSADSGFFYPSSVTYDFSAATFQILLHRSDYPGPIAVLRYDEQLRTFKVFPATQQRIPGSNLELVEVAEGGLYRILAPGLDYIYSLRVPVRIVNTSGPHSRILAEVIPQLESGQSQTLFADLPYTGVRRREIVRQVRAVGRFRRKYITLIPETFTPTEALIHPLQLSFSQPAYAELPGEIGLAAPPGGFTRLFFQDPQRTREGQIPLVYLSYLEADDPVVFSFEGNPSRRRWTVSESHSGITAFTYARGDELRPVNLAAREFFRSLPEGSLVFDERQVRHLPYFLILLALYLTKLLVLLRLQREVRAARES